MKTTISTISISTFALFLLVSGGCAIEGTPSVDTTSDEPAPSAPQVEIKSNEGGWQEIMPGLRVLDDGEQRTWSIEGEEAQLVFQKVILRELKGTSDQEKQRFYEQVLEGTDAAITYSKQNPSTVTPRSTTTETTIVPVTVGGEIGLKAHGYAHRSWGYTRAEAYVNIDGTVQQQTNTTSDACVFGCSSVADAQATAVYPTSCTAKAYAQVGGSGYLVERNTCPSIVVCCPQTACYAGQCGNVPNGCGGWLYCGTCGGGCGCGCDPSLIACE